MAVVATRSFRRREWRERRLKTGFKKSCRFAGGAKGRCPGATPAGGVSNPVGANTPNKHPTIDRSKRPILPRKVPSSPTVRRAAGSPACWRSSLARPTSHSVAGSRGLLFRRDHAATYSSFRASRTLPDGLRNLRGCHRRSSPFHRRGVQYTEASLCARLPEPRAVRGSPRPADGQNRRVMSAVPSAQRICAPGAASWEADQGGFDPGVCTRRAGHITLVVPDGKRAGRAAAGCRSGLRCDASAHQQSWSRLSEQFFRVDKWSLCRG